MIKALIPKAYIETLTVAGAGSLSLMITRPLYLKPKLKLSQTLYPEP